MTRNSSGAAGPFQGPLKQKSRSNFGGKVNASAETQPL
jgi:hypothetical protein